MRIKTAVIAAVWGLIWVAIAPAIAEDAKPEIKITSSETTTTTAGPSIASKNFEKTLKEALAENSRLAAENTDLKKKFSTLQNDSKVVTNLNAILRDENEKLRRGQMDLESTLRKAEQLTAQVAELEKQNKDQAAKVQESAKKVDEVAAENLKLKSDTDVVRLQKDIEEYKRKVKNTEAERDKAISEMARALKQREDLIRDSALLHYNLGAIFFKQRDYKKAIDEFKRSAELNPLLADAYYNLAIICDDYLADINAAIIYYKKYLELTPNAKDANQVTEKMMQAQLKKKATVDSPLEKSFSIQKQTHD
ncbi:MAG TPA: tetratricopeptide repeat protein [Patescibacteria group bacterium]|nr:tetratricopeptide repeat protein [Patescibacteria group bacterium]